MTEYLPTKTITYAYIEGVPVEADYFKATGKPKNKTVIYYHGGGLIYGTRKDLPLPYLTQFLEAGYDILTVDYPLTPESSFEQVMATIKSSLTWFLHEGEKELCLKSTDYILFGRSAGAYLANWATKEVFEKKPCRLILLYGYYNLEDPHLTGLSAYYQKMTRVDSKLFYSLIQKKPITNGSVTNRYLMYLYLRQTGTWPFLRKDLRTTYSLTLNDFKTFPKTFLAYSNDDKDVPPDQSRAMVKMIPDPTVFVVDDEEHDFDRDSSNPISHKLYTEIINWLD